MFSVNVFGAGEKRAYYDCEYVALPQPSVGAKLRKELTYKFASLVIFSHGKVKYELGCATEQMLDRFCTSLVRRLICRAGLDMSLRRDAMESAVEFMALSADGHSCRYDSACARETMKTVADLAKWGKNPQLAREFVQTAYAMLRDTEKHLSCRFPGFGNYALAVINELCADCRLPAADPNWVKESETKLKKRSALEWILAAAAGFIMLPVLL